MSELQDNIQNAIANAAAKIAEAETVEEAQQWQSIISNLTGSLQTVNKAAEVEVADAVVVEEPEEN